MPSTDSSLEVVRDLRSQQEKLVWSAYIKALATASDASSSLHWARCDLEEAIAEFQQKQQAGAPRRELRGLEKRIQSLRECRRDAELKAAEARRHANQALVSVLSAQRACASLAKFAGTQKVPVARILVPNVSSLPESRDPALWN